MITNDNELDAAIKRLTEIFNADPTSEEGKEAQKLVDAISEYEKKYQNEFYDALNIIRSYNLTQKMKKNQEYLFDTTGMTSAERFQAILKKNRDNQEY